MLEVSRCSKYLVPEFCLEVFLETVFLQENVGKIYLFDFMSNLRYRTDLENK